MNDSSKCAISNTYKILKLSVHENYKNKDPNYDIALIELERSVNRSSCVWPICIPESDVRPDSIVDKSAIVGKKKLLVKKNITVF